MVIAQTACRALSCASLTPDRLLVGACENLSRLGIAMTGSQVIGESRRRPPRSGMRGADGRKEPVASRNQEGLAFRGSVAQDQRPAETCLGPRRAPALGACKRRTDIHRGSQFGFGGR